MNTQTWKDEHRASNTNEMKSNIIFKVDINATSL